MVSLYHVFDGLSRDAGKCFLPANQLRLPVFGCNALAGFLVKGDGSFIGRLSVYGALRLFFVEPWANGMRF